MPQAALQEIAHPLQSNCSQMLGNTGASRSQQSKQGNKRAKRFPGSQPHASTQPQAFPHKSTRQCTMIAGMRMYSCALLLSRSSCHGWPDELFVPPCIPWLQYDGGKLVQAGSPQSDAASRPSYSPAVQSHSNNDVDRSHNAMVDARLSQRQHARM